MFWRRFISNFNISSMLYTVYMHAANAWSSVFQINFAVRQGLVLSQVLFAVYLDDIGKLFSPMDYCYIILYADDILLIAYTEWLRLLHRCEQKLSWLDMNINFNKSCYTAVNEILCVKPLSARAIVDYLGSARCAIVHFVKSRTLKCSLSCDYKYDTTTIRLRHYDFATTLLRASHECRATLVRQNGNEY